MNERRLTDQEIIVNALAEDADFAAILEYLRRFPNGEFYADLRERILLKPMQIIFGHKFRINAIEFSPDGKYLISGQDSLQIFDISDIDNVKIMKSIEIRKGSVNAITISHDSTKLAISCSSKDLHFRNYISIYSLEKDNFGEILQTIHPIFTKINQINYIHKSTKLVAGMDHGFILIWDVSDLNNIKEIKKIETPCYHILSQNVNNIGNHLVSGSLDGNVIIHDISNFEEICEISVPNNTTQPVNAVRFSTNGNLLASGYWKGSLTLFDTSDFSSVKELCTFSECTSDINSIDFSPDGKTMICCSAKPFEDFYPEEEISEIYVWDIKDAINPKLIRKISVDLNPPIKVIRYSPDGRIYVTGGLDWTGEYDVHGKEIFKGAIKVWATESLIEELLNMK